MELFVSQNDSPDLKISRLLGSACPHLSEAEKQAYDAPFPDVTYKAGVRTFPLLVCDTPNAEGAALSREAKHWWETQWTGKSFMAIGMKDPVLGPEYMKKLHSFIRNCPPPLEIAEAGHFVQEWGEAVARGALERFMS